MANIANLAIQLTADDSGVEKGVNRAAAELRYFSEQARRLTAITAPPMDLRAIESGVAAAERQLVELSRVQATVGVSTNIATPSMPNLPSASIPITAGAMPAITPQINQAEVRAQLYGVQLAIEAMRPAIQLGLDSNQARAELKSVQSQIAAVEQGVRLGVIVDTPQVQQQLATLRGMVTSARAALSQQAAVERIQLAFTPVIDPTAAGTVRAELNRLTQQMKMDIRPVMNIAQAQAQIRDLEQEAAILRQFLTITPTLNTTQAQAALKELERQAQQLKLQVAITPITRGAAMGQQQMSGMISGGISSFAGAIQGGGLGGLSSMASGLGALGGTAAAVAGPVGIAISALAALHTAISGTAASITSTARAAQMLNADFQGLQTMAILGPGIDSVTHNLNHMQRAIAEAQMPHGVEGAALPTGARLAFQNLGIDLAALGAMQSDQQFRRIADGLNAMTDPAQRAQAAQQIFGRGAMEMSRLISMGSAGIEEAQRRFASQGVIVRPEDVQAMKDMQLAFKEMKNIGTSAMNSLAIAFAPLFTSLGQMIDSFGPPVLAYFKTIFTALSVLVIPVQILWAVITRVMQVIDGFMAAVQPLVDIVVNAGREIWKAFGDGSMDITAMIRDLFAPAVQALVPIVKTLADSIVWLGEKIASVVNWIRDYVPGAVMVLGRSSTPSATAAAPVATAAASNLAAASDRAVHDFGQNVSRTFRELTESFARNIQGLQDQIADLRGHHTAGFSAIASDTERRIESLQQSARTAQTAILATPAGATMNDPHAGTNAINAAAAAQQAYANIGRELESQIALLRGNAAAQQERNAALQRELAILNTVTSMTGSMASQILELQTGSAFGAQMNQLAMRQNAELLRLNAAWDDEIEDLRLALAAETISADEFEDLVDMIGDTARRGIESMTESHAADRRKLQAMQANLSVLQRNAALTQEAAQLIQSQRGPLAIFQDAMSRIGRLAEARGPGDIPLLSGMDLDTARVTAFRALQDSLPQASRQGPAALSEGSAAAVSAINAYQRANQPRDYQAEVLAVMQAANEMHQQQLEETRGLARALAAAPVIRAPRT